MDDGRRRRRKGAVPGLPSAVAVRPGRCADAGRRRRVGRHLHPRGRARPSVRAQTAAVAGGAERIPGTEDWVGRISPISGVAVVMINSRASAGDFAATRSFDYTFGVRLPGPRRDVYVQTTVDRRDRRTETDHRVALPMKYTSPWSKSAVVLVVNCRVAMVSPIRANWSSG